MLGDRQAAAAAVALYLHPAASSPGDPGFEAEAVRFQGSVLNGVARIWAPRYRQADREALRVGAPEALDDGLADAQQALDALLAGSPPSAPIFVLGHDQGAMLGLRLLQTRFRADPALARRLVVAYLAGLRTAPDDVAPFPVCASPDATGCVAAWAPARPGAPSSACGADRCPGALPTICFNPVRGSAAPAPQAAHRGAGPGGGLLGGGFAGFSPGLVATRCAPDGTLWIDDTAEAQGLSARELVGVGDGDYHLQAVNLFYLDLRADAARRLAAFEAGR
ncbi:MAG: DUF3089 domain-containing protein [bacterium]